MAGPGSGGSTKILKRLAERVQFLRALCAGAKMVAERLKLRRDLVWTGDQKIAKLLMGQMGRHMVFLVSSA
jgi:hypothetical protein